MTRRSQMEKGGGGGRNGKIMKLPSAPLSRFYGKAS